MFFYFFTVLPLDSPLIFLHYLIVDCHILFYLFHLLYHILVPISVLYLLFLSLLIASPKRVKRGRFVRRAFRYACTRSRIATRSMNFWANRVMPVPIVAWAVLRWLAGGGKRHAVEKYHAEVQAQLTHMRRVATGGSRKRSNHSRKRSKAEKKDTELGSRARKKDLVTTEKTNLATMQKVPEFFFQRLVIS